MKTAIRLKDLAESLNLSVSTVSKSINNSPEISRETKKRVQELAELKNYLPNIFARNLKQKNTRIIGIILPNLNSSFYIEILKAIEVRIAKRGYQVMLCISNEILNTEINCVNRLIQSQVDGIIISPAEESLANRKFSHINKISDYRIPIVIFDRLPNRLKFDKVGIDQSLMIEQSVLRLYSLGYRKVGYISKSKSNYHWKKRRLGYNNALKKLGIKDLSFYYDDLNSLKKIRNYYFSNHLDVILVELRGDDLQLMSFLDELKLLNNCAIVTIDESKTLRYSYSKTYEIFSRAKDQGRISVDLVIDRVEKAIAGPPINFRLRGCYDDRCSCIKDLKF